MFLLEIQLLLRLYGKPTLHLSFLFHSPEGVPSIGYRRPWISLRNAGPEAFLRLHSVNCTVLHGTPDSSVKQGASGSQEVVETH